MMVAQTIICEVQRGCKSFDSRHILKGGFSGSSDGKESACNTGDLGSIPRLGRPHPPPTQKRKWQPTPVFLPGKSHGQRSLAGYSAWGHKELDMTEKLISSLSDSQEAIKRHIDPMKLMER